MNLAITRSTGGELVAKARFKGMSVVDRETMEYCLKLSPVAWEASVDGKGACIWGMIPPSLMSDRAYIWLWTTDVADAHQFILVRRSRMMMDEMLKEYSVLVGCCHVDDPRAARWLRWLGAEFGQPDGKKIPFQIRKK